jgi:hypothetical protein
VWSRYVSSQERNQCPRLETQTISQYFCHIKNISYSQEINGHPPCTRVYTLYMCVCIIDFRLYSHTFSYNFNSLFYYIQLYH